MERMSSGNAELDSILGGGFPANAIHVVMGSPGTGKTILTEQLAFANATEARPALYLTTFSEPLPKFLTFLQEYSFADAARVGTEVIYASLGEALSANPASLVDQIADLVQQHRPGVLVIDSFKAIADLMHDVATWRRLLYEVAGLLSAYRTTSFWVGEYSSSMAATLPEFAVADGIVELTREQHGSRDFRFLRVVKLRGSNFLDGFHAVRVTRDGLRVFPRLVTPVFPERYEPAEERLGTGIPRLDAMMEPGLLGGTTTLVHGPSGSGKTLLSLQFLIEGARAGEPSLLLSFEENPIQLRRVMRSMGWDPDALLAAGLEIVFTSPVELQIDTIIGELFERVKTRRIRRLVIDGLGDLAWSADDPLRIRDYLFSLTQQLAAHNVTSMFTVQQRRDGADQDIPDLSYLADNTLLLEVKLGAELARTVRVVKSRGSKHEEGPHTLRIGRGGIVVE